MTVFEGTVYVTPVQDVQPASHVYKETTMLLTADCRGEALEKAGKVSR